MNHLHMPGNDQVVAPAHANVAMVEHPNDIIAQGHFEKFATLNLPQLIAVCYLYFKRDYADGPEIYKICDRIRPGIEHRRIYDSLRKCKDFKNIEPIGMKSTFDYVNQKRLIDRIVEINGLLNTTYIHDFLRAEPVGVPQAIDAVGVPQAIDTADLDDVVRFIRDEEDGAVDVNRAEVHDFPHANQ